MNLITRKKEIEDRLAEIRKASNDEMDVEKLSALEKEVDALQEERTMIEKKIAISSRSEIKVVNVDEKAEEKEMLEQRGKDLKESRTIKVSSYKILTPEHVSNTMNEFQFKDYSSIVDKVSLVNLEGGESYKKAYVKYHDHGNTTPEATPYNETMPVFDYATISKVKVTAYTEITEELEKLAALPYQAEVIKNINIALKKKIASEILLGLGNSDSFQGIFSTGCTAIDKNKDLAIEGITESTLDDIVFSYGGDEEVEDGACLILNKNDLRAFAKLRTAEGRKLHTIDYKEHTIDGIPYIISSNCKALSSPTTNENEYCMAYGSLKNYEVPIFSPVEICKSNDFKFKDGIICYKASVFTGGNVVAYNGFLRIKKSVAKSA